MRRMRETHERLMALVDPPYMRQLREMFDATQMQSVTDIFAGSQSVFDPALFVGVMP